jgi:hypothetical protein
MLPSVVASDPAHHANALSVSIQKHWQPRHPQPYAVIVENPAAGAPGRDIAPLAGRRPPGDKSEGTVVRKHAESRFRVEVTASPV